MLEKVPSLSLDQIVNQSKEQRLTLTIPIHRIFNWWKNRNMEEEKEDKFVNYIEDHFDGYEPDEEEVLDFIYETNIEDIEEE